GMKGRQHRDFPAYSCVNRQANKINVQHKNIVVFGHVPVLERRNIAGYATDWKGKNSRKEQYLHIQKPTVHFVTDCIGLFC
ncbi:MAG: hypothetical protein K2G12_04255, partial [Prevotella sp.]|nr:hypothetical protein [Prevotella sp.]